MTYNSYDCTFVQSLSARPPPIYSVNNDPSEVPLCAS